MQQGKPGTSVGAAVSLSSSVPPDDSIYLVSRTLGGFGGGSRAGVDILQAMLEAGNRVVVVTERQPQLPNGLVEESARRLQNVLAPQPWRWPRLGARSIREVASDAKASLGEVMAYGGRATNLRTALRAAPPTIVFHNGFPHPRAAYLGLIERASVAPRVMIVHSSAQQVPGFAANLPGLRVDTLARQMSRCHGLVFVSPQIRDEWLALMESVPSIVRIIPPCARDESIGALRAQPRDRVRDRLGFTDRDFVIVTVGKVHPIKGQDLIVESMPDILRHVPNARLVIVGQRTKESASLDDAILNLNLGDRVAFTGGTEKALEHIYAADVLVHASRAEGLGLVIAEAMALGTAVVASDAGGARSLILDGVTGLSFPVGDSVAMVQRLLELVANPAQAHSRAVLAVEHYRANFSRPAMTAAYTELLADLWTEGARLRA